MGEPMDPALFGVIFGVGLVIALVAFWSNKLDRDAASASTAPGMQVPGASTAQLVGAGSTMATSQEPSPGELLFWQSIKDSKDASEFSAYLAQFPQGFFRDLARNRLASLGVEVPPTAAASPLASTLAPTQAPAASVAAATTSPPPAQTGASATRGAASGNALIWAALIMGISIFGAVWLWVSIASYADCVNLQVAQNVSRYWAEKSCKPSSS